MSDTRNVNWSRRILQVYETLCLIYPIQNNLQERNNQAQCILNKEKKKNIYINDRIQNLFKIFFQLVCSSRTFNLLTSNEGIIK